MLFYSVEAGSLLPFNLFPHHFITLIRIVNQDKLEISKTRQVVMRNPVLLVTRLSS